MSYEKDEYDKLCETITSREDIDPSIKQRLLDISFAMTTQKIEDLRTTRIKRECKEVEFDTEEIIDRMSLDIEMIYQSALSNVGDPNILGFINIFMFQCSVMFSIHEGLIYYQELKTNVRDNYHKNVLEYLSSIDWKDYSIIKGYLMNDYKFKPLVYILETRKEYTIENIKNNPKNGIILVRYLKEYTSINLIPDYLNRVCYVELVSQTNRADGNCLTSIEYLYHDINHALNFFYICRDRGVDIDDLKEFYIYIEKLFKYGKLSNVEFCKIRAFIYFEIHEGFCYFTERSRRSISINDRDDYERLFRQGDLYKLVPPSVTTIEQAKEYFQEGRNLYNEYFDRWKHKQQKRKIDDTDEPSKKRTRGGKQNKLRKSKKIRKYKKRKFK